MATPTPGKHTSMQATATPPASTPFSSSNHLSHLVFTPHGAQFTVPSPQQIKKSPANSQTIFNHGTTGSFGAAYDSPSAAMALGGISSLSDLVLDGLGGVPGLRRDDEEERRRKLELVSDILKQNAGRVSEPGIERLARLVGFECLWESHGSNTRTLIIAGSTLALDIDLCDNTVKSVSLTFPDSPEIVTRHTEKANEILLRDIRLQKNENPLTKMLDKFSRNLRSLAALDKMSILPGLNCHEAISGIYESLERLYNWEIKGLTDVEEIGQVEKFVMCTKSGKPVMHTRDRLGLSLDYWQNLWRIETKTEGTVWSILIECDTMSGLVYTPIRISSDWISSDIQKKISDEDTVEVSGTDPTLDWLEPESTFLLSSDSGSIDNLGQSGNQNFPEVMFVAKFNPPLIVPGNFAAQIYDSVQATLDIYQTTTYDGLIFPPIATEKITVDSRSIFQDIKVPIYSKSGEKSFRSHRVGLHFEKIDFGRTLTNLPFSHPRQLIQILPALRQYALMSKLLQNYSKIQSEALPPPSEVNNIQQRSNIDEFESFMAKSLDFEIPMKVDILVSTQPFPRLRILFPFRNRIADLHVEIKLNGAIEIIAQNIFSDGDSEILSTGRILTVADLGRMLEITEDFGIWIEYIRKLMD